MNDVFISLILNKNNNYSVKKIYNICVYNNGSCSSLQVKNTLCKAHNNLFRLFRRCASMYGKRKRQRKSDDKMKIYIFNIIMLYALRTVTQIYTMTRRIIRLYNICMNRRHTQCLSPRYLILQLAPAGMSKIKSTTWAFHLK